ncbi:uncharacterized protein LOC133899103 [Phragmites australis]|uniref:uncharacterized protein LOC133899103 n=1 Tax=Phragmites australis TaxID=29695 RepID=UPI002D77C85F|nr:uncharacterized protein LOC133899103 [Phragmites australis]
MAVPEASPSMESPKKRSSILGSLRTAIKKVRFLLSFSATRWMLLSSISRRAGTPRRGISFSSPRPSLLDVDGSIMPPSPASSRATSRSASMGTATTRSVSRTSSAASPGLLARTSSGGSPAGDDDIDRRAEQFIANFHRQLQMERQVSLQLRYIRGNSRESSP